MLDKPLWLTIIHETYFIGQYTRQTTVTEQTQQSTVTDQHARQDTDTDQHVRQILQLTNMLDKPF